MRSEYPITRSPQPDTWWGPMCIALAPHRHSTAAADYTTGRYSHVTTPTTRYTAAIERATSALRHATAADWQLTAARRHATAPNDAPHEVALALDRRRPTADRIGR